MPPAGLSGSAFGTTATTLLTYYTRKEPEKNGYMLPTVAGGRQYRPYALRDRAEVRHDKVVSFNRPTDDRLEFGRVRQRSISGDDDEDDAGVTTGGSLRRHSVSVQRRLTVGDQHDHVRSRRSISG